MSKKWIAVVVLMTVLPTLACSVSLGVAPAEETPIFPTIPGVTPVLPPQVTAAPDQTPSPPSIPTWPLALADDFEDASSGFGERTSENRRRFYADGRYSIEVFSENWIAWASRGDFSDFALEVDVTPQGQAGYAGLIFRKQGDNQFYFFHVAPDGKYRLRKWLAAGEENWVTVIDWTESPHIATGQATNRLRVVCIGSELSLYVNDRHLESVRDTSFTEGELGVAAATFHGESYALFHFDNLQVYAAALVAEATPPAVPEETATPMGQPTAAAPQATETPLPQPTTVPVSVARIAFESLRDANNEIYVMDADGSGVTRLTHNPGIDHAPAWSPDRRRIAFMSSRDGNLEIYLMNADGTGVTRLTNSNAEEWYPAWSPDGRRIAFVLYRGDNEIYVMNADGSGQVNLTNNPAWDTYPTWSPDSRRIAFASNRGGNSEIYVMNADGSGVTRLTNNPANDSQPSWSPEGGWIVFVSTRDGNEEIYLMHADGSGTTRLTNSPSPDLEPCWSPDGRRIAFTSYRDGNEEIYIMNADGSGVIRLTNNPADDWAAAWAPG